MSLVGGREPEHLERTHTERRRPRTSCCGATEKEMECMNEWMSKGFTVNTVHSLPRCRDIQLMSPLEPLRGLELVDRIGLWKVIEFSLSPHLSPSLYPRYWYDVIDKSIAFKKGLLFQTLRHYFLLHDQIVQLWFQLVPNADKLSAPSSVDHRWYLTDLNKRTVVTWKDV